MQTYCAHCGEKRPDRDDWKLQSVAGEAFSELTNLEHSKLWRTLRLLVFKPGELTRDHWAGRRKAYLGPLKLYLIFFALTLVLYSIHQPTAVYDVRTLMAFNQTGNLPRVFDRIAHQTGKSPGEVVEQINSRWQAYISWSQLLYPLFVALAMKLLFLRRGLYLAEHLIFALHVLGFTFLSFVLLWPGYFVFGIRPNAAPNSSVQSYLMITACSVLWTATYITLALRRAYDASWTAALAKGLAIFLVYLTASLTCTSAGLVIAIRRVAAG